MTDTGSIWVRVSGTKEFCWDIALTYKSWVSSTYYAEPSPKYQDGCFWFLSDYYVDQWHDDESWESQSQGRPINFECSGMSIRKKEWL